MYLNLGGWDLASRSLLPQFNLISLNIGVSSISLPGTPLMLEPCILYFPFLTLLCLFKMFFMRFNYRTKSMICISETSFVCGINPSLFTLASRDSSYKGKSSHILHQNTIKTVSRPHTVVLLHWNLLDQVCTVKITQQKQSLPYSY